MIDTRLAIVNIEKKFVLLWEFCWVVSAQPRRRRAGPRVKESQPFYGHPGQKEKDTQSCPLAR